MAEGARLEIVCTERYRGFESLSLLHWPAASAGEFTSPERAGVRGAPSERSERMAPDLEAARLEIVCTERYRGFESLSLLHWPAASAGEFTSPERAGVRGAPSERSERMAPDLEAARLEIVCTERYRGFESLSLLHWPAASAGEFTSPERAGVRGAPSERSERMAPNLEAARLEIVCTERYRGFESLSLLHWPAASAGEFTSPERAGVRGAPSERSERMAPNLEAARLEIVCTERYRGFESLSLLPRAPTTARSYSVIVRKPSEVRSSE